MPEDPFPEWPAHFPNNCPDDQAIAADGAVFRLVCGDDRDWKSAKELGEWTNPPECQRASLSCFLEVSDAADLRDALPKFENHKIVKAMLEPKHGKMKRGGKGTHVSVWLRTRFLASVQELFEEVT